jgi:hypothetical protein
MNKLTKMALVILVGVIFGITLSFQTQTIVTAEKTESYEDFLAPKSLCSKTEQTIWSCTTTKNKIASVCAAKGLTSESGYLQYRFGTTGKVELELPQNRAGSQSFFKYSRYTRPLVTMLQLSFKNSDYTYEIHDDDNSEEKPPIHSASIDISKSGSEKTSSIVCRNPTAGSLMKLEDIVPKDEDGIQ